MMSIITHLLAFMAGGTVGIAAMAVLAVAKDDGDYYEIWSDE